MSNDTARRAHAEVLFDGVDISKSLQGYLHSMTYTDNEEDQADDLQIRIEDRDGVWLCKWLVAAVQAAATAPAAPAAASGDWKIGDSVVVSGRPQYSSYGNGTPGATVNNHQGAITHLNLQSGVPYPIHVDYLGWFAESQVKKADAAAEAAPASSGTLQIRASIVRDNWTGDGKKEKLFCGEFELDSLSASGPPATITIKASSLPYSSQIRQTKKSKAWESYKLSGIARDMAAANGMACLYESSNDPFYERIEQTKKTDISFLSKLCHDAGISLKVTDKTLVLFDQTVYEAKPPVATIKRGAGGYQKYKLETSESDTQYSSCRVSYTPPGGKLIEAIAYVEDYDAEAKNNQRLEVSAKVSSIAEAKALAEKQLRLRNKYAKTVSFTLPGNPLLVAGITVALSGWGLWDGKYIIKQAVHAVGGSDGYTVQIKARSVLGGY